MKRNRAKRKAPALRRYEIIKAATYLVQHHGFDALTRDRVAKLVGVGSSTVGSYFPRMNLLHRAVIVRAHIDKNYPILARILTTYPKRFKPELRDEVINYLKSL